MAKRINKNRHWQKVHKDSHSTHIYQQIYHFNWYIVSIIKSSMHGRSTTIGGDHVIAAKIVEKLHVKKNWYFWKHSVKCQKCPLSPKTLLQYIHRLKLTIKTIIDLIREVCGVIVPASRSSYHYIGLKWRNAANISHPFWPCLYFWHNFFCRLNDNQGYAVNDMITLRAFQGYV